MADWRYSKDIRQLFLVGALALMSLLATLTPGWADHFSSGDLTELSLKELMEIEITSVSKKPQKLSDAAAAVSSSTPRTSAVPA